MQTFALIAVAATLAQSERPAQKPPVQQQYEKAHSKHQPINTVSFDPGCVTHLRPRVRESNPKASRQPEPQELVETWTQEPALSKLLLMARREMRERERTKCRTRKEHLQNAFLEFDRDNDSE